MPVGEEGRDHEADNDPILVGHDDVPAEEAGHAGTHCEDLGPGRPSRGGRLAEGLLLQYTYLYRRFGGIAVGEALTGKADVYMCRNIKRLRRPEQAPTEQELHDAALQFVRKISGFNAPSRANQDAFDGAVRDVAGAARVLFQSLHLGNRPQAAAHAGSGG